jgi:uncharacterized phage protein gp47/JayE
MPVNIPTTQELTETNLANFESKLNQSSPLVDKAFLRVLAAVEAMSGIGLHKYAVDAVKQNLARSASEDKLAEIGDEYDITKKVAESARLVVEITASDGATIDETNYFVGVSNNLRYTVDAEASEVDGLITVSVTASESGVVGNLADGAQMQIGKAVANVARSGNVESTTTLGVEEEEEETYRARILFAERTAGGGGNAVDYKTWAEETPGVKRAYPYAGIPADGEAIEYVVNGTFDTNIGGWTDNSSGEQASVGWIPTGALGLAINGPD